MQGNAPDEEHEDPHGECRHYIERMNGALKYVADMTHIGTDGEWHFKRGYDPQRVLDALME